MTAETPRQPCDRQDALEVVRRLRAAGHVAYFAGGCVRDLLLGKDPKDYDVATDAPPGTVRDLFRASQAVGASFGVILVRQGRSSVEVATFRTDGAYLDGRRPQAVRFTNAEQDARRRDFTINGLFLDPIDHRVIDYVGGQADLQSRLIRAIGKPAERFDEDSLRLLRAVRFSGRLSFQIETQTAAAIRAHAPQLRRISPERIADELRLMLCAPTRERTWKLLWELELVYEIFRFLPLDTDRLHGQGGFLFGYVSPAVTIPFGLALAAAALCYQLRMTDDDSAISRILEPPRIATAVRSLRQSLRTSNDETEAMESILTATSMLLGDPLPSVAKLKRFLADPQANSTRRLLDAIESAGLLNERIALIRQRLLEMQEQDVSPVPFLDGKSLISAGLRPGPLFRSLIDAVYDAQLEGEISTPGQALEMALKLAERTNS